MMPNRFFVYGTLRPGEVRWNALESYATSIAPAKLYGAALYTTGSYPFILLCNNYDTVGEIITVKSEDVQTVIRRLDQIEGYSEKYPDESLFIRITHPVSNTITGEDESAYMYVGGNSYEMAKDQYRRIESGDWKQRNAERK